MSNFPLPDKFRDSDDTCSYCGSLNPETLMRRLENGDVELGPTDKNYKVYVRNVGGSPFRQTYSQEKETAPLVDTCPLCQKPTTKFGPHESHCLDCGARYGKPRETITRDVKETKFYWQHLSEEQMKRFVQLLNERKISIGAPGHFYVRPFFVSAGERGG